MRLAISFVCSTIIGGFTFFFGLGLVDRFLDMRQAQAEDTVELGEFISYCFAVSSALSVFVVLLVDFAHEFLQKLKQLED